MRNNKIAFFIQDFNGGGAERMMINLANGMVREGFSVDLLVVRDEGPYQKLVANEVRIHVFKNNKVLLSIKELASYLKQEKPLALYSTLKHVNIASIIANQLSGYSTQTIIREACHLLTIRNKGILQTIAYKLVPYFYKRADDVVAVSKGVAESINAYCKIPLDRIHILPNPSITDDLILKAKENPNHPFYRNRNKIILGAGRLSYQKNFEGLIEAFSIIKKDYGDELKLVILGEGDYRDILEKLIYDYGIYKDVSMPGFVTNPYSYMSHAALFVLSSRFEGSPNVLVEAMGCGTPVVSTNCPSGPAEILKNGKFGRLVPIENVEALVAAIKETLKESEAKDVSAKVKSRAMDYHVDSSVKKYLALIR